MDLNKKLEGPMDLSAPLNLKPLVKVSLEQYTEWHKAWQKTLIVRFLGKQLVLPIMDRWAQRIWAKKGIIRVLDLEEYFFPLRFVNE